MSGTTGNAASPAASPAASRRFWSDVAVVEDGDGFAIRLDGRPMRLGEGGSLRLPNRALADAVALEWRAAGGGTRGGSYGPDALDLTRLSATMLFRVAPDREAAIRGLLGYLDGDALCYRATHPDSLAALQEREWQPWLDWCRDALGATLHTTAGIMPIRQTGEAHDAIARALARLDDAALTASGVLAPALGSLVLALACVRDVLPAGDAHRLSILDDRFQNERWGLDAGEAARQAGLLRDCVGAERFARLAGTERCTHLLIRGRVQGVGYRNWLQHEAMLLGLRGWVRNLADSRVEAMLWGAATARADLVRMSHDGPRLAAVQSVDAHEQPAGPEGSAQAGFLIRPSTGNPEPRIMPGTQ